MIHLQLVLCVVFRCFLFHETNSILILSLFKCCIFQAVWAPILSAVVYTTVREKTILIVARAALRQGCGLSPSLLSAFEVLTWHMYHNYATSISTIMPFLREHVWVRDALRPPRTPTKRIFGFCQSSKLSS